jgi:hypothetical protein
MAPEYLLELHWRDGRIEPRPSGEFGWSPLEVGAQIELNGNCWRIRDVVPQPGFDAKIVLGEEWPVTHRRYVLGRFRVASGGLKAPTKDAAPADEHQHLATPISGGDL